LGFPSSELNLLAFADIEKQRAWFVRASEPGVIGKLRGRNDLNAMSRRSSSDGVAKLLPAFPFGLLGWRA